LWATILRGLGTARTFAAKQAAQFAVEIAPQLVEVRRATGVWASAARGWLVMGIALRILLGATVVAVTSPTAIVEVEHA
jgi:hypothetical protein